VYNFRFIKGNFLWLHLFVTQVNYEISGYKGVKSFSVCMLRVRFIPHVSILRQSYDMTVELCVEGTCKPGKAVIFIP
jgi:hypothetical protein